MVPAIACVARSPVLTCPVMRKPLIGITADLENDRYQSQRAYANAVRLAGGVPMILPHEPGLAPDFVDRCDGILMTGGDDPAMERFGLPTHPSAKPMHPDRQASEIAILDALSGRPERPFLGICLGMQLMSLHAGGTFDQHLADSLATAESHRGNKLHRVSGEIGEGDVVSSHRQAVTTPGRLSVVARSPDGVIEAVRDGDRRFYVGVQWHPERTGDTPLGFGIIRKLVQAAAAVCILIATGASVHAQTTAATDHATLCGIDVLVRDKFKVLAGKRVGLITNHTGMTRDGRATVDVLAGAEGFKLVALFSPEHGIRGDVDAHVPDGKDQKTGLPIFSLYGKTREPRPETLEGIDTLVYDIQDVGCRFYTYISTLGITLEAAARRGLDYVVLDRPNPINGDDVEGPLLQAGRESFVGWHRIPVRHGMTVGELARLFDAEKKLSARLTVIKVEGWTRHDFYDATGLRWVNPSPNMRSLTEAILYPGIGLLEVTNLSVGRGTDTPFERIGAPWLDGQPLAIALERARIPGASFIPIEFTPTASVFKGERCGGINVVITDRKQFRPLRTVFEIAVALRRLHPEQWHAKDFGRMLASTPVLEALLGNKSAEDLERLCSADVTTFRERRKPALLY